MPVLPLTSTETSLSGVLPPNPHNPCPWGRFRLCRTSHQSASHLGQPAILLACHQPSPQVLFRSRCQSSVGGQKSKRTPTSWFQRQKDTRNRPHQGPCEPRSLARDHLRRENSL